MIYLFCTHSPFCSTTPKFSCNTRTLPYVHTRSLNPLLPHKHSQTISCFLMLHALLQHAHPLFCARCLVAGNTLSLLCRLRELRGYCRADQDVGPFCLSPGLHRTTPLLLLSSMRPSSIPKPVSMYTLTAHFPLIIASFSCSRPASSRRSHSETTS
jgi:hypothetical protein